MIRRDYASQRQAGPVAGARPPAPQRKRPPLILLGLVPGLALSALVGWLLLRHHGAAAAQPQPPAVAAAAPQKSVALPPRQHSKYDFYHLLTSAKAADVPAEPPAPNGAQP